jgi:hypothetical protein
MSKFVRWLLIALVALWVIHDPAGAAAEVHRALHLLNQAGAGLGTFVSKL